MISPATLAGATVGNKFSTHLTATGGSGSSYTFTAPGLSSSFPWLSLSPAGLLTGTPSVVPGTPIKFTVTVTDSNGFSISKIYTLTVKP